MIGLFTDIGSQAAALLGLWLALRYLNLAPERRFLQWPIPIAALVYCLLCIGTVTAVRTQWLDWAFSPTDLLDAIPVRDWLAALDPSASASPSESGDDSLLYRVLIAPVRDWLQQTPIVDLLNLAALAGFVLLKTVLITGRWFGGLLKSLLLTVTGRGRRFRMSGAQADEDRLGEKNAFYRLLPGNGVVLREERVDLHRLAQVLAWFALAWLLFAVAAQRLWPWLPQALLPAIPVILLFECVWFLGGRQAPEAPAGLKATDEPEGIEGDYRPLVRAYLDKWNDHWLAQLTAPAGSSIANRHAVDELIEQMQAGRNLLAPAVEREEVQKALLEHVMRTLAHGNDVLFLLPEHGELASVEQWIRNDLLRPQWLEDAIEVRRLPDEPVSRRSVHQEGSDTRARIPQPPSVPCCRIARPDEMVDAGRLDYLAKTRLLILTNIGDAMADPLPTLRAIERACLRVPDLQVLMFGEPRENLTDAIRRTLPIDLHEIRAVRTHANETFSIAWPIDTVRAYQQDIFKTHASAYLGAETVLATLAWARGAIRVRLGDQRTIAWRHYSEALQNHRNYLRAAESGPGAANESVFVRDEKLDAMLEDLFQHSPDSWFSPRDDRGVLLVQDELHNLPATIDKWANRAHQSIVLHAISPPYLLREYLVDNLDYFFQSPIQPLTPKLEAEQSLAWVLAEELRTDGIDEQRIESLFRRLPEKPADTIDALEKMLRDHVLAPDSGTVRIDWEWIKSESDGSRTRRLRLPETSRFLSVHQPWELVDESGNLLDTCHESQVFQRFLPEQIHAFNGLAYRLRHHDQGARRSVFFRAAPRGEFTYRPALKIELKQLKIEPDADAAKRSVNWQHFGSCRLRQERIACELTITPHGFYRFKGAIVRNARLGGEFQVLKPGEKGVEERVYRQPAAWRFTFRHDGADSESLPECFARSREVSWTLAFLLEEMLPTLFPGCERSIHILAQDPDPDVVEPSGNDYLKRLVAQIDSSKDDIANSIVFHVVEDSPTHLGLARAFTEEWPVTFGVLYDYLCWLLDESRNPPAVAASQRMVHLRERGHRKPFLGFGEDEPLPVFKLQLVRDFLEALNLGHSGTRNSHHAQRRRFFEGIGSHGMPVATSDTVDKSDPEGTRTCHFCRSSDSADFAVLPGARYRCARCNLTALDTEEKIREAVDDAWNLFERVFSLRPRRTEVDFIQGFDFASQPDTGHASRYFARPSPDAKSMLLIDENGTGLRILLASGMPHSLAMRELIGQLARVWLWEKVNLQAMLNWFEQQARGSGLTGDADHHCRLLLEGVCAWAIKRCMEDIRIPTLARSGDANGSDTSLADAGLETVMNILNRAAAPPFSLAGFETGSRGRAEPFLMLQRRWPRPT